MKAVMISEQPNEVVLIINGEKTIAVFKTAPKLETPFKCYIYMTHGFASYPIKINGYPYICNNNGGQVVIGEFICDEIKTFQSEFADNETYERIQEKYAPMDFEEYGEYEYDTIAEEGEDNYICQQSCLKWEDLRKYIGQGIHEFYGWHISDLKIYDEPKEISEFNTLCKMPKEVNCENCPFYDWYEAKCVGRKVTRPPKSWCYVEEIEK